MEILKALLIGTGVCALLRGTDGAPSNLEVALIAGLWAAAVGLVFRKIARGRQDAARRSSGRTGKEKT
ncbi:hypothetical protein ACTTAL_14280 [Rhodobacter capsulatus]|uniref:hypothetical protein n=1 Tax=Rhodobacter capsulatus TaxID=1061 RepID=UPI0003D39DAD|nr:hypothetical protein [Rhodobacter capsulatus]ETD89768.1 hypothetical protein U713_08060 [Rhodobacter capsulatus YW2]